MDNITKETTCFNEHSKANKACKKSNCRHWLKCKKYFNCSIIAAKEGPFTLQEIGDMHGLTRMRICQIEKNALNKIREKFFD